MALQPKDFLAPLSKKKKKKKKALSKVSAAFSKAKIIPASSLFGYVRNYLPIYVYPCFFSSSAFILTNGTQELSDARQHNNCVSSRVSGVFFFKCVFFFLCTGGDIFFFFFKWRHSKVERKEKKKNNNNDTYVSRAKKVNRLMNFDTRNGLTKNKMLHNLSLGFCSAL